MREIKFRVPVTKYETGEFVKFLYETLDCGCFAFNECMRDFPNTLVIGEEEQFTGQKDKNGREIYEGDIDKKYGPFFFQDGCIGLKCGEDFFSMSELFTMPFYIEIIGNIHENPDLLEK